MELIDHISRKKIIVCCGSGGVGKTTTSAAIALKGAQLGMKVLVLTIDPAKRLANSLGLKTLDNVDRLISADHIRDAGIELNGSLYAMMLDNKMTFDELIERYALDNETKEKIFKNNIYRNLSGALAGSHEYMAMEKLYEIHKKNIYDLIVLDTPPTKQALDFLDAPRRMIDFLQADVLKWFLKPYFKAGKLGFRIFRRGTSIFLNTLEKIFGMNLLREISEFLKAFEGMYGGFKERAENVMELLGNEDTLFFLITSPNYLHINETIFFYKKLREYNMPFNSFIINMVNKEFADFSNNYSYTEESLLCNLNSFSSIFNENSHESQKIGHLIQNLKENFIDIESLATVDRMNIERLKNQVEEDVFFKEIPFFAEDIHDLSGLNKINSYLFTNDRVK